MVHKHVILKLIKIRNLTLRELYCMKNVTIHGLITRLNISRSGNMYALSF